MSRAALALVAGEAPAPAEDSPWMTEAEAAAYMRFTVAALRSARYEHRGPAFSRVGRAIRYHRADLDAHLQKGRVSA